MWKSSLTKSGKSAWGHVISSCKSPCYWLSKRLSRSVVLYSLFIQVTCMDNIEICLKYFTQVDCRPNNSTFSSGTMSIGEKTHLNASSYFSVSKLSTPTPSSCSEAIINVHTSIGCMDFTISVNVGAISKYLNYLSMFSMYSLLQL